MKTFWAEYHWGVLPHAKYEVSLSDPQNVNSISLPFDGTEIAHADYVDVNKGVQVIVSKDLYRIVAEAFKQWWYVLLYVISMVALSFHMIHGFSSAFQTLGWNHNKYIPAIKFLGIWVFGVLIPLGFAAMPIYFFFFR